MHRPHLRRPGAEPALTEAEKEGPIQTEDLLGHQAHASHGHGLHQHVEGCPRSSRRALHFQGQQAAQGRPGNGRDRPLGDLLSLHHSTPAAQKPHFPLNLSFHQEGQVFPLGRPGRIPHQCLFYPCDLAFYLLVKKPDPHGRLPKFIHHIPAYGITSPNCVGIPALI